MPVMTSGATVYSASQIADGIITGAKLVNGAVTIPKMATPIFRSDGVLLNTTLDSSHFAALTTGTGTVVKNNVDHSVTLQTGATATSWAQLQPKFEYQLDQFSKVIMEAKVKITWGSATGANDIVYMLVAYNAGVTHNIAMWMLGSAPGVLNFGVNDGGATNTSCSITETAWNTLRLELSSSSLNMYLNDVLSMTITANIPSAEILLMDGGAGARYDGFAVNNTTTAANLKLEVRDVRMAIQR